MPEPANGGTAGVPALTLPPIDRRPPITQQAKQLITEAFAQIPPGKRGALILIGNKNEARLHVAARLGEHWKVAFEPGVTYAGDDVDFTIPVAVMAAW